MASNGFVDSGGNSYGFGLALYTFDNHPIMGITGRSAAFTQRTWFSGQRFHCSRSH
jgi:hypothetical protein